MLESSSLTGALYAQAQKAIDEPFTLAPALIALIFLLVSTSAIQSYNNRQRLAPGIPIVGVDEKGSVKAARKRFLSDARGLLREGYEKVGTSTWEHRSSDGGNSSMEAFSTYRVPWASD